MKKQLKNIIKTITPDMVLKLYNNLFVNNNNEEVDWYSHIENLVNRDIIPFIPNIKNKPKAIIWAPQVIFSHLDVQYFIALALQLRGWEVNIAFCNSNLPNCLIENARAEKIPCEECWKISKKILDSYKIPYVALSECIKENEIISIFESLSNKNIDELVKIKEDNYNVGEISKKYLTYYFHSYVEITSENLKLLRRVITANIASFRFAEKIHDKFKPDLVITVNGKLAQNEAGYIFFKNKGVRVITWDNYPPFDDSYIFCEREPAIFSNINKSVWDKIKEIPSNTKQLNKVKDFLDNWENGKVSSTNYHPTPEKSIQLLKNRFGIDCSKKIFVAFTNVMWDSACLDRDIGFESILDWLYSLIDWFSENEADCQLIIRIHPGEKRMPDWAQTPIGIEELIRKKYPVISKSIIIIGAEDDTYSYSLSEIADAVSVYTSSLGYELAAKGKRVWVAGDVHYRGLGFTLDILSKEHLVSQLDKTTWNGYLTENEVDLAYKYIYFRIFRQVVRVPFFKRIKSEYKTTPFFKNLFFLRKDRDPLFTTLIDRVIDGGDFYDIPNKTNAKWVNKNK